MRLRVLTWPVRPRYLRYLSCVPHELFVVSTAPDATALPVNVRLVAPEAVAGLRLDCVLFQSRESWQLDRERLLSPEQRRLPRIYLEHEPPSAHATDEVHHVDDPDTLLVHVSHHNAVAWQNGRSSVRVIEHGAQVPEGVLYSGKLPRGITVADQLALGGRRAGRDVFEAARREVRIDLVGRDALSCGGLGELPPGRPSEFMSAYRFYFDPSRNAGISVEACEAMMVGLPVVALSASGIGAAVRSGVSGYVDADLHELVARMRELLASPGEAWRLGQSARRAARERFDLRRFTRDWDAALRSVAGAASFAAPCAADRVEA